MFVQMYHYIVLFFNTDFFWSVLCRFCFCRVTLIEKGATMYVCYICSRTKKAKTKLIHLTDCA